MVTFGAMLFKFLLDDSFVCSVGGVDGGVICVEVLQDKDPWPTDEDVIELVLPCVLLLLVNASAVVDRYVLLDVTGQGICSLDRRLLDQRLEYRQGWFLCLRVTS